MTARPAIQLFIAAGASTNLVDEFHLGCEEEGVPCIHRLAGGEAETLAREAASASDLFVGAGIDERGRIAVHEQRLGMRQPLILVQEGDTATGRIAGGDAARLVLGRRLRSITDDGVGYKTCS